MKKSWISETPVEHRFAHTLPTKNTVPLQLPCTEAQNTPQKSLVRRMANLGGLSTTTTFFLHC